MKVTEFFNEVENLKAEFNTLKETKNCFLNTKTNQIIPIEQAGGKDLRDFKFQLELPNKTIDSIMQNKIQELFGGVKENKSDEVSEFLKNNPDWYLEKPITTKGETVFGGFNSIRIKVVDISRNRETKRIRVTFKILDFPDYICKYQFMKDGFLIYDVTLTNYYVSSVKFNVGEIWNPSSINLDVPEYFTREINGITLYKFRQVRSLLFRMSGTNMRRK
ncbi:MAG: hypothetical protein ACOC2U_04105 [bacterium]